jgi:hypothetical protein
MSDPGMPPSGAAGAPVVNREAAASAVRMPGTILLVLVAIGLLVSLARLVAAILFSPEDIVAWMQESFPQMRQVQLQIAPAERALNVVLSLGYFAAYVFALFGLIRMVQLRSWGIALAGVILAMINPGGTCCCCLTLPFGVWAIVVLAKPEVKAAFA